MFIRYSIANNGRRKSSYSSCKIILYYCIMSNLNVSFGNTSTKSFATGTQVSSVYISGDTTIFTGDIYTVQSINVTVTENFNLSAQDDNHDIYEISYNFDITPSIILPDSSTISNGYKATLVNTNFLSIGVSVYDETNDKISSWGLTELQKCKQ